MGSERLYNAPTKTIEEIEKEEARMMQAERPRITIVIHKTGAMLSEIEARINALLVLVGERPGDEKCNEEPNNMKEAVDNNLFLAQRILCKLDALGDAL